MFKIRQAQTFFGFLPCFLDFSFRLMTGDLRSSHDATIGKRAKNQERSE